MTSAVSSRCAERHFQRVGTHFQFYTTTTSSQAPSSTKSAPKVLRNDNGEEARKVVSPLGHVKGSVTDVQETSTTTESRTDENDAAVAATMAAAKAAAERSTTTTSSTEESFTNEKENTSHNEQQEQEQQKKKRSSYVGPLFAGLSASFLCYLFIHNTLTTQADNIIFHMDTIKTIQTMQQIEEEKQLLDQSQANLIKKKRDAALDYHVQNMSYETSAWLKFTRAWNSIWKNISIEIDKQYQKENDDKVRKEEERKRLRQLG
eukprot:CAMPEP_0117440540 /NCGR_PEP_ID=MMETSP0759-20121206/3150_1 /TAXON_ID=63605 /ORGANISM="Percolomonas cosmopolitus, Strain WS" /LENGTH=261 /DNA_ID=CAMNT_0005232323 /DNA_START=266 /DNA_END=1048 /DNA_ORIENTATION=-